MGLDIYFYKKKKSYDETEFNQVCSQIDEIYRLSTKKFEKEDIQKRLNELELKRDELDPRGSSIAYFRKVNFLVAFFNVEDDCSYVEITKEQVEELINRCKRILDTKVETDDGKTTCDENLAEELLPTQSGFFFGSTNYDEYYIGDVEEVLDTFTKLLSDINWEEETMEIYCWW